MSLLLCAPAQAASPPVPASKAEALEGLQNRLEKEKEERDLLEARLKNVEKQLAATRQELVRAGESVRSSEKLLWSLESRIAELSDEEETLADRLDRDRAAMAELVLALERIRRTPPEALIVRPGAPLETAHSALLLRTILPAVNQRAASVAASLDRLATVRKKLEADRQEALLTRAALQGKYDGVAALVKKREDLYSRTNAGYQETLASIERISKEAKSLQELLARLGDEESRQAGKSAKQKLVSARAIPRAGAARLPVSGIILTRFGEKDNIGAASQGLKIRGQSGGLVVAPMGGVVRFAGEFKNYGSLAIIEHKDNYHSLIGGLEDINIAVGQKIDAGEPIGKLPNAPSLDIPPTLYYELRHKGSPVDPSGKFSELKS